MRREPSNISIPASRFRELRWHVWKAIRGVRLNPQVLAFLSVMVLLGSFAWANIPELHQIRFWPSLELEIVQTDKVLSLSDEQLLESNFDYITLNPTIELYGMLVGRLFSFQTSGLETAIIVDGKTISSQSHGFSFPGNEYSQILKYIIELESPGIHRIELVLHQANNRNERIVLDKKIFLVKKENTPPTKPIIFGFSKITNEKDVYRIRGSADPHVQIIVKSKSGSDIIAITDKWGYFQTSFLVEQPLSEISVASRNFAGDVDLISSSNESEPFRLSELQNIEKSDADTNYVITLGHGKLTQEYRLITNDENLLYSDLLLRKIPNEKYITTLAGFISINNNTRGQFFNDKQPEINYTDGKAIVSFKNSAYFSSDFSVLGDSVIEISFPDGFPIEGNTGQFQIQFVDGQKYLVESKPDIIEGNLYTWKKIEPGETVNVRLSRGSSKLSLELLGNLNYFDVSGSNRTLSFIMRAGLKLVGSLPLLAILWFLYSSGKMSYSKPTLLYARSIVLFGMQILYIPIIYETFNYGVLSNIRPKLFDVLFRLNYNLPAIYKMDNQFILPIIDSFSISFMLLCGYILIWLLYLYCKFQSKYIVTDILLSILRALSFLFFLELIGTILGYAQLKYFKNYGADAFSRIPELLVSSMIIYHLIRSMIQYGNVIRYGFRVPSLKKFWNSQIVFLLFFGVSIFLAVDNFSIFRAEVNDANFTSFFSFSVQNTISKLNGLITPYAFLAVIFLGIDAGRRTPWRKLWMTSTSSGNKVLLPFSHFGWALSETNHILLGQIIFSGFIVGTNENWIVIPISFIAAWLIYKHFLINKPYHISQIAYYENLVRTKRSELLAQLVNDLAIIKLQKKKEETFVNLAKGKINLSEQENIIITLDKEIQSLQKLDPSPLGVRVKDIVLAFGPYKKPIKNAVLGLKTAFLLQLPLLYIFIQYYLFDKTDLGTEHLWLILLSQLVTFISGWLILGFFFGLLYEFIRGNNGLRKALFISGAYALSLIPYRLLTINSSSDFSTFIFEVGQTAILLVGIGLFMDWETLKKHGYRFSYLQIVVNDIPSLVSVTSILITTAGIVITSILSGQLTQLMNAVLGSLLPTVTNIPFQP